MTTEELADRLSAALTPVLGPVVIEGLRALTGGRGEYTMEFLRYEEVPGHLAQKVVQEAQKEAAAA